MAVHLTEAATDRPDLPAAVLYVRMLPNVNPEGRRIVKVPRGSWLTGRPPQSQAEHVLGPG